MKTNALGVCMLLAAFISCDNGSNTGEDTLPYPRNIQAAISGYMVIFVWDTVPGASGYEVFYGTSLTEGTTLKTAEPYITISGLDMAQTYYFTIQTKGGGAVSSLPSNPIILRDGVIAGTITIPFPGGGESPKKPPEPEPFNYDAFMAEKAAWEKQGIGRYRFIAVMNRGSPGIHFQVTAFPDKKAEVEAAEDLYPDNVISEEAKAFLFYPLRGKTIDELYGAIADAVKGMQEGYRAWIRYNKEYHYPDFFCAAPIQPDPIPGQIVGIIGGGYDFTITGFEVLDETE
jgi:hypothetical protein